MAQRGRRGLSYSQERDLWIRWKQGQPISEIARREWAVGQIVSILHARLEGPIPLEPELAHELEAVSERLAAGRPANRRS